MARKSKEEPDPLAAAREAVVRQGSDLVTVKKALEDSTSLARNLWISFITFGTYLIITFSGVDHKQLFLATPIELPVLNAGLPLVTFFWVAPILFVIFHLYLLLNLKLLADQVHGYDRLMAESGADAAAVYFAFYALVFPGERPAPTGRAGGAGVWPKTATSLVLDSGSAPREGLGWARMTGGVEDGSWVTQARTSPPPDRARPGCRVRSARFSSRGASVSVPSRGRWPVPWCRGIRHGQAASRHGGW
jgi:hypothetical protein